MNPAEAFAVCEAAVRGDDADRYFASLFAPAEERPLLFALYAFNYEIARATVSVHEPMMGEVRLQWWREAVGEAARGAPRAQPVAIALAGLLARAPHLRDALEALIDARTVELSPAPFADLAALEFHAAATAGALMRIAAFVLDPKADISGLAREAGTAYGLSGILRALPFYAAHRKTFLPADLLAAEGIPPNDAQAAGKPEAVRRIVSLVAARAKTQFACARAVPAPRHILPAVLPAALVPASLALVARAGRDPLRSTRDLSPLRRQLILLRAAAFGRL